MAEFKLGRIRFIWKGTWTAATTYYKDDVVRNGGNTYICIAGHDSPTLFTTDQSYYWNKISDGIEWKEDWSVSTYYKQRDIVKYGGYLYVANTAHTSAATIALGLEADQTKWDLFAEGFDYKDDWAVSTRYKVNDIAKYNGLVYICIQEHTSAATIADGLEIDQAKWNVFSEGFYWRNNWSISTRYRVNDVIKYNGIVYVCNTGHTSAATTTDGLEVDQAKWDKLTEGFEWTTNWSISTRYRVNDIVKYGGQLYVCNTGHTSAATIADGLEIDQAKWDYLNKGIEYKGDWASATRYKVNDFVKWGGGLWICITNHTSTSDLGADESNWNQFVEALEFEDSWNVATLYQPGDIVSYGGYIYVAKTNHTGTTPTTPAQTDWDLFTTGFKHLGAYNNATAYKVGDVVSVGGYTYLAIADTTGNRPPNVSYWNRLNSGLEWNDAWTDATYYDAGDVVRLGNNSYVCILEHTSDEISVQNRPDQDITGINWNLVAAGAESSVLTTDGDLLYYSGSGPVRLPIGAPGQVLSVDSVTLLPKWSTLGATNNIFYVEKEKGSDTPAPLFGSTTDRPWSTVRYATEQIIAGALRASAKGLLEKNRSFIQAEVVEYIDNTYPGLTYTKETCRRDIGQIVDALIWDLSHGGNSRTRAAALAYFDNAGTSYLADNPTETAAGISYIKILADAVLTNVAPATNYQNANGVGSPITQVIDLSLTEELDALSVLESLVDIVTEAITTGNTSNVPQELAPANTLFIKSGTYPEVLPIIVPDKTTILGDEVRSVTITPLGSVINSGDVANAIDAISRLQSVISNVVQNISITKSTSNAALQVTTRPAGSAGAGAAAAGIVQDIYEYIDFKINANGTEPTIAGVNAPVTSTDYTYAVETLEANRSFLVAEIAAYVTDNQPGNTASYETDVNRYIDAVKHDLIYTGNYKALLAASYYVNKVTGSELENMFLVRNATSVRNLTVSGLNGTLGTANPYGTQRPTAGAYVSLDPGWGPAHTDVWITSRSPYIQNVSTFGTACIGMKVDGALHDGGNDSILGNDFTQVISDGIGAWVTNLGRAELVSVFSYYAHIGYLAEAGGKIRATNGNSSYGTYGCVAEGVDVSETPITGTVNNRANQAIIARVLTDGDDILTFEYLNAGNAYTAGATTFTVTGEGFGSIISSANVVDGAVYEVRLTDPADNFGGEGYVTVSNLAQTGSSTTITLSATDTGQDTTYDGMAIYITSGLGAGQYARVASYNSGTKVLTVEKFSDGTPGWDHVTGSGILSSLDESTTYSIEPSLEFTAPPSGLYADTTKARAVLTSGQITNIYIWEPGNGYLSAPTMTIVDPNNTVEAPFEVRVGNGVLTQPTWTNRGTSFATAQATVNGDGYADIYQPGEYINVSGLSLIPTAGSNIVFNSLTGDFFKVVTVRNVTGTAGNYNAQLQISPRISVNDAPPHNDAIELRLRYSQVRLTGHDFLDVGTGNITNTNYPNTPLINPDADKEIIQNNGGRVFYTSTDQDGNFRVGRLFNVEQATGVATLDASAFNISGLRELQLGSVELGGTGAVITEFSTDGTFTANSDNIVPTQKAIKTYIASQIGGGAGALNVNSLTAGSIQISSNQITTTNGDTINIIGTVNYTGNVSGAPIAINYFLAS